MGSLTSYRQGAYKVGWKAFHVAANIIIFLEVIIRNNER